MKVTVLPIAVIVLTVHPFFCAAAVFSSPSHFNGEIIWLLPPFYQDEEQIISLLS